MIYKHNSTNINPSSAYRSKSSVWHTHAQPNVFPQKGLLQAHRNNSDSIWSIFGTQCSTKDVPYIHEICIYCQNLQKSCPNCTRSLNEQASHTLSAQRPEENQKKFAQTKNSQKNQNIKGYDSGDPATTKPSTEVSKSKNRTHVSFQKDSTEKQRQDKITISKEKQKQDKKTVSKEKSPVNLNRVNRFSQQYKSSYKTHKKSMELYLKQLVPYTRTLSNSAFRRFYQRPCPQTYGSRNINEGGIVYGNYMKTHNVQPHLMTNHPKKYQTHHTALQFGKRGKTDPDDRWLRIHRQLMKNLNLKYNFRDQADGLVNLHESNPKRQEGNNSKEVKAALRVNITELFAEKIEKPRAEVNYGNSADSSFLAQKSNSTGKPKFNKTQDTGLNSTMDPEQTNILKRSKSSPYIPNSTSYREPFYIYKYKNKNNQTQYAKDRHGLTCYIDPSFMQNDGALVAFMKTRTPLQAENVKKEDKNIDKIRVMNYLQSKQRDGTTEQWPKHYLKPIVDVPDYLPEKYTSWRFKKAIQKESVIG